MNLQCRTYTAEAITRVTWHTHTTERATCIGAICEHVAWGRRKALIDIYMRSTHNINNEQRVRCGSGYSQSFHIGVSVRQGSVLSPLLFATGVDFFLSEPVKKDVLWKCRLQMIKF